MIKFSNEPIITINGKTLSIGQAMTVRVAIESFMLDLDADGLGDDDTGRQMTANYKARINEIRKLIHNSITED